MKKKLLLILMFMTMFIVGNRSIYALECKVGEAGCTEQAIRDELGSENDLACLYEVTLGSDKYYTYIYRSHSDSNSNQEDVFYGSSTYGDITNGRLSTKINMVNMQKNYISEDAYKKLNENMCPEKSYIVEQYYKNKESNLKGNSVCFDDNGECKNVEKITFFESDQKSNLSLNKIENTLSYNTTYNYSCDHNVSNFCTYANSNMEGGYIVIDLNTRYLLYSDVLVRKQFMIFSDSYIYKPVGGSTFEYDTQFSSMSSCPAKIYLYKRTIKEFENSSLSEYYYYFTDGSKIDSSDKLDSEFNLKDCNDDKEKDEQIDNDCTIFDEDLTKTINDIMNIVRIAIPLLLIGLITYDFATAIFASDEKAINKAKTNAIKRIIIAIVVFFVPTIVNLLFNIVNEIWGTQLQTCGISENVDNSENVDE